MDASREPSTTEGFGRTRRGDRTSEVAAGRRLADVTARRPETSLEANDTNPGELLRRNAWDTLAEHAPELAPLDDDAFRARLVLADAVAFALGQLQRPHESIALLERAFALEPTSRRASALAYHHYTEAMRLRQARTNDRDLEPLRRGFHHWIDVALRLEPDSIKNLYRLGIFEAQVESAHDKVAVRAFLAAIRAYDTLDDATRERRHDLYKPFLKSLYAGARSAHRIGEHRLARKLVFRLIREDPGGRHVERLHALGLAGKVCRALGELDAAERALRLALDADGPRRRDYLFGELAEVEHARGRLDAALAWIEHVRAERRPPHLWRLAGDLHAEAGHVDLALAAYESALAKDRMGRHLTLFRIGYLHESRGAFGQARRAYERANEFRRRTYSSEHRPALEGLQRLEELAPPAPPAPQSPSPPPPTQGPGLAKREPDVESLPQRRRRRRRRHA